MGILAFLIVFRIKRIFDFKNHPFKTISIILSLCISIFYGYLFANLYNSKDFQEKVLSHNEFEHYFILSLLVITLLKGFFPSYIPIKNIISKNFPFSKLEKYFYNISNEFVFPYYIGIILFVLTFSVVINKGSFIFFLITLHWIVIAHFLKRLVQLFIDFKLQSVNIILILLPIFIMGYFIFFFETIEFLNYPLSLSIMVILILINYLFEYKSKEIRVKTKTNSKKSSYNFYFLKLLLNNKLLRTMSFLSITVKIVLIFASWSVYQKNGQYFSESEFFVYIFISPVILFSYFFNNFFGFSPTIWLSIRKVGGNLITYSKEMLKVLVIPLIIDVALTAVFLFISNKFNFNYISFYLSNLILLFPIGILNSFYFPKQVKSLFAMSGATSIISNIFSISAVIILIVLTIYFKYLAIITSIIIILGLYLLTNDKISNTQYKIFQKLFS